MNRSDNDIEILQYPVLSQFSNILHFTSTRSGGVSTGSFASMNLGMYSGDNKQHIDENLTRFCNEIGIQKRQLFLPFQTHGCSVLNIDKEFLGLSTDIQAQQLTSVDAIITNLPDVCIAVSTADCVPIILYDPFKKAIASVHAGWKGTCLRILSHTVHLMESTFGVNPKNLIALLGPSISPEVYEVGAELTDYFRDEQFDVNKIFHHKNNKILLDLWKANKEILLEQGVIDTNIQISGHCTYSESGKFFSARRLGIKSGRMLTGIMLKSN